MKAQRDAPASSAGYYHHGERLGETWTGADLGEGRTLDQLKRDAVRRQATRTLVRRWTRDMYRS